MTASPTTAAVVKTAARQLRTRCCIVGGGPAGMMLGLLLARGGVAVTMLEKHADFLRDFRGDTVHPSTLEILQQLGLLDRFAQLPHRREDQIFLRFVDGEHRFGDFRGLKPFPYIALVPQWDFLDLLSDVARGYPGFELKMRTQALGLLRDGNERITGVRARDDDGEIEIQADLVVACDGRGSILRQDAGLAIEDFGAPMDVLWFRLPRKPSDPDHTYAAPARGRAMVMLDREDYWQAAYLIRKGSGAQLREQPLQAFRNLVAPLLPFEAERLQAISSWDEVKHLEVRVDRLRQWYLPGLLLIGDAAHAMSPIGGVGINLAIQDAVATANLIGPTLRNGGPIDQALLARVQQRRLLPTRIVQSIQLMLQKRVIAGLLDDAPGGLFEFPWVLRLLTGIRAFRQLPGRLFGYGIRRERVEFGPR